MEPPGVRGAHPTTDQSPDTSQSATARKDRRGRDAADRSAVLKDSGPFFTTLFSKRLGISPTKLAEQLGVHKSHLYHWQDPKPQAHSAFLSPRAVPEILDRLGPATLSPEHQRSVQAGVKRLHEVSGVAFPTIHDELRQHFHVGKYEQIPEERWAEVADWFKRRIDAAQKRRGTKGSEAPEQGGLF